MAPALDARLSSAVQFVVSPSVGRSVIGWQYVAQAQDNSGRTHYVIGHLAEPSAALTLRGTMAVTPRISLQVYAQPFLTHGGYGAFGEVTAPRSAIAAERVVRFDPGALALDGRSSTYVVGTGPGAFRFANPDFSERDYNSNVVLRWEYRAGSTLYVVWSQVRNDEFFAGLLDIERCAATVRLLPGERIRREGQLLDRSVRRPVSSAEPRLRKRPEH